MFSQCLTQLFIIFIQRRHWWVLPQNEFEFELTLYCNMLLHSGFLVENKEETFSLPDIIPCRFFWVENKPFLFELNFSKFQLISASVDLTTLLLSLLFLVWLSFILFILDIIWGDWQIIRISISIGDANKLVVQFDDLTLSHSYEGWLCKLRIII